jgi:integrase
MSSNTQLVEKFLLDPKRKESTRVAYRSTLRCLSKFLHDKPFDALTVEELDGFLQTKPATITRLTNLWKIKCFLRWLYDDEELPKEIRRYNLRFIRKKLRPQDLLTPEEVQALLDGCNSLRDKTLVMMLYGTGCRISELLHATVGDIVEKDGVWRIHVNGKTGEHLAFIKEEAVAILKHWLTFLTPASPNQSLFPPHNNPAKPLNYSTVRLLLAKATRRAGITKRVHPHLFRHMRNTDLVRHVGKDKARMIMGYAPNSPVIDQYTHLTDDDATNSFLQSEGRPPLTPTGPQRLPAPSYVHPLAQDPEVQKLRKELKETQEGFNEMTDKVLLLYNKLKVDKGGGTE